MAGMLYQCAIAITDAGPVLKTLTFTNNEALALNISSGVVSGSNFSFSGGAYPGSGGTCGTTLSTGVSCTLVLAFDPPAIGQSYGNLTMNISIGGVANQVNKRISGYGLL
jgi:hypothetical protein